MRILFLHSSADLYGADRCLLRLVSLFPPGVCHAVLPMEGPLVAALRAQGAEVELAPLAVLRRQGLSARGIAAYAWRLAADIRRLGRLVRTQGIGLVYSNTTAVSAGGPVARRAGIPHVQHVREIIERPRLAAWLTAQSGRWADPIVCVSEATRAHFLRFCPGLSARTRVIHDGVDPARFRGGDRTAFRTAIGASQDAVVFGMIGRVSAWKGQDLFVESAARFVRACPTRACRFVMVGSAFRGQEWREQVLEAAIREQGLADRVRMLPFREDIRDVLAGCDVFVLPSTRPDPFPNTVLEAMASGLPVVASAAGGVREMIEDGVSGRLVQPNNPQAFCEAWRELAADPGRRRALGQAAAERAAREFSVEKHDAAMRELFASIRPSASPDRGRA